MVLLEDLKKTYGFGSNQVEALKGVSLNIQPGEIFGIVGYSGAGKSTLIRCINLLERPTTGRVIVNGRDLTTLSSKELRNSRKKIGMIFQHFNLMGSRSVMDNIAFPLKGKGLSKQEIFSKVTGLLQLVGLGDKANAYPSQLSGGQKQRVAIARALANDPEVLLCDEATSALDPQTTKSILKLLKEINEKLNLTIILITHEMQVVKEICHKVAVMEDGYIVEEGDIIQVFSKPKTEITKEFIATIFQHHALYELLEKQQFLESLKADELLVKLSFVGQRTGQPFISRISRLYKIEGNILFGNIESIQGVPIGNLIVKLSGPQGDIQQAIKYLEEHKIEVEVINHDGFNKDSNAQCDRFIS